MVEVDLWATSGTWLRERRFRAFLYRYVRAVNIARPGFKVLLPGVGAVVVEQVALVGQGVYRMKYRTLTGRAAGEERVITLQYGDLLRTEIGSMYSLSPDDQ